jgi:hypothetical protein
MGKSKDIAAKEIMPSTTRGGTNIPTRVKFSPANATPAVKKKSSALHSSPLSDMSMPNDTRNELLDKNVDDEETPDLSDSSSRTVEPSRETIITNASKSIFPHDCAAFSRAFVDMDLDDLDKFDALIHTSLRNLFPIASKDDEPIIFIKASAYEFSIKTEAIEWVEKRKFHGRDDEYHAEHIVMLHDISNLYGNDEVPKHYYFLKLFPFSLGGDAKTWYHFLPSKSITSKDSCAHLFYNNYITADKMHAMEIDSCNFA